MHITHYPIDSNGPKHADEGVKNNIDVIVAKAENIEDRKQFDEKISLEIVPVGIIGPKKLYYASLIWIAKKIYQVFVRIFVQQLSFLNAVIMKAPCINHLCMVTVINAHPAIKDPGHYFQ
jgi:hypothetical protein